MKTSKPIRWKEKFFKIKKIAETPPLNREGFWKQHKVKEPEFEQEKAYK